MAHEFKLNEKTVIGIIPDDSEDHEPGCKRCIAGKKIQCIDIWKAEKEQLKVSNAFCMNSCIKYYAFKKTKTQKTK